MAEAAGAVSQRTEKLLMELPVDPVVAEPAVSTGVVVEQSLNMEQMVQTNLAVAAEAGVLDQQVF